MRGPLLFGDVLSFIITTPECVAYRLDTIKWIQAQLQDATTATSEATLGAIMTLAMWEVSLKFLLRLLLKSSFGLPFSFIVPRLEKC